MFLNNTLYGSVKDTPDELFSDQFPEKDFTSVRLSNRFRDNKLSLQTRMEAPVPD